MIPLISKVLRVGADELLGITQSSEGRETSGELWIRVDELQMQLSGIQSAVLDPMLNQSQVDSIFDPTLVTGESKRVLVVDDADFMRMMLRDMVTRNGHTFLTVRSV